MLGSGLRIWSSRRVKRELRTVCGVVVSSGGVNGALEVGSSARTVWDGLPNDSRYLPPTYAPRHMARRGTLRLLGGAVSVLTALAFARRGAVKVTGDLRCRAEAAAA